MAFDDFKKRETEVKEKTEKEFSTQIEYFQMNINLTLEAFDFLLKKYDNPKIPLPTVFIPISLIIPRLIFTLKSIFYLTVIGHYYDANILGRTFFENLGLCMYLSESEERVKNWMHNKRVEVPYIELFKKPFSFRPKANLKSMDRELNRMYGKISEYVHDSPKALIPSFVVFEKEASEPSFDIQVDTSPNYSEEDALDTLWFPGSVILNLAFREMIKNEIEEELDRKFEDLKSTFKSFAK